MSVLFQHARKLDAAGQVDDFWMLVEGDTILSTGAGDAPFAPQVFDVRGDWLTPGFIDIHCHGGGGHSFDDGADEIIAALEVHRSHGTTRSVISLVASPMDALIESVKVIADLSEADPLILGSHLEGPYLATDRRGAHNLAFLRDPSTLEIMQLLEASRGTLRQVTIAPELAHALDLVDVLVASGVIVAVGHTEATFNETRAAFGRGARLVTHAFNAMPGIHHREPGPIIAAFEDDRVAIELILDGSHVHPSVAALAFASAPDRVVLVSDAMAAAGFRDGNYSLGSLSVEVRDGRALVKGTDTIAGSTLTLDRALRIAIDHVGIDPREAIKALTLTPARVLGIEHRYGLLAPGFVADAVSLTPTWRVRNVWASGSRL